MPLCLDNLALKGEAEDGAERCMQHARSCRGRTWKSAINSPFGFVCSVVNQSTWASYWQRGEKCPCPGAVPACLLLSAPQQLTLI